MRRLQLNTILLIVIYGLLSMTTLFVSDKNHQILLESKLGNGFVSDGALSGTVQGVTAGEVFTYLSHNKSDDFTVQIPLPEPEAVAFYSSGQEAPPLVDGRFFTEEEQRSANAYALVGQNEKDRVENGQIFLNGVSCRVVGIMGADSISPIDNLVFLNLSSQLPRLQENYSLTIDGTQKAYEAFQGYLNQRGAVFTATTRENVSVLDVAQGVINDEVLYVMVIACFALSCVAFSSQWFHMRRKIMAVKSLIGIHPGRIYLETVLLYFLYLLLGCTIGTGIGLFLVTYLNFTLFFVTLAIAIAVCLVLLSLSLFHDRKISVAKAVK